MRKCFIVSLVLIILASAYSLTCAEPGNWKLGLSPGYAIPIGDFKNYTEEIEDPPGAIKISFEGSFALQAYLDYQFTETSSLGLELGHTFGSEWKVKNISVDIDEDGLPDDQVSLTNDAKYKMLQITPVAKFGKTFGKFRPYGALGAGLYHTWRKAGKHTYSGICSSGYDMTGYTESFDKESHSYFGINVGAGTEFKINDNLVLGVDIRYHRIFEPGDPDVEFILPTARLAILFGS